MAKYVQWHEYDGNPGVLHSLPHGYTMMHHRPEYKADYYSLWDDTVHDKPLTIGTIDHCMNWADRLVYG